MNSLSNAISQLIQVTGRTDEQLSRQTGIPASTIAKYRRAEGEPPLIRAMLILAAAYQARPHKQELPESAKYLSIGNVLHREDVEK